MINMLKDKKDILVTVTTLTYDGSLSTYNLYFREGIEAKAFVDSYVQTHTYMLTKFDENDDLYLELKNQETSILNPVKQIIILAETLDSLKKGNN